MFVSVTCDGVTFMDIANLDYFTDVGSVSKTEVRSPATGLVFKRSPIQGGFNTGNLYFAFSIENGKSGPEVRKQGNFLSYIDSLDNCFCTTFNDSPREILPVSIQRSVNSFTVEGPGLWSVAGGGTLDGGGIFSYGASIAQM